MAHSKLSARYFHLIFSLVMAAQMVFIMTFFITLINLGWHDGFFLQWLKAYCMAYVIAVPVVYHVAPITKKMVSRWVQSPTP